MFYTVGIRGALTFQTKPHVFVWNMFGDLEIRLPFFDFNGYCNMDMDIDESATSMDFEQLKFEFQ